MARIFRKLRRFANFFTRPIQEFGVEERSQRAIDRNKDKISPKHPSTRDGIAETIQNLSEEARNQLEKTPDADILNTIQSLQISNSNFPDRKETKGRNERPLPQSKKPPSRDRFTTPRPCPLPLGSVTVQDAMKFISANRQLPKINTRGVIAEQFKLDPDQVGDVLQHFETFRLYAPTRTEICRDMDGTIPLQQTLPPDMPLTPQLRRELDKMGLTERPREGVKTFRVDQIALPEGRKRPKSGS